MRFEFATATRIVFGNGSFREALPALQGFGTRALLVTGKNSRRADALVDAANEAGVQLLPVTVHGEPTVSLIRKAVAVALPFDPQAVLAMGGGSVIDAAKAIAALLANPGDPLDYLEVIGGGKPLAKPVLPVIAIPTTAGTGSEVTRNAVLGSEEHGVKASLRSPGMLPALAIVDPELTVSLPPALTASTGLDALTQLIEPYVCARANPITDGLCAEGIQRVARSLRRACANGEDLAAREDMALASLFGGLALANAGLGVVHAFAAPVGGGFPAPHGAVCAALLPHGIRANVLALHREDPEHATLARYRQVAQWLTGIERATVNDAVSWLDDLLAELEIPGLASYGIQPSHAMGLAQKAARTSSMKANPVNLHEDELASVLLAAL
jgi:alcohol dehydrogenase class IV